VEKSGLMIVRQALAVYTPINAKCTWQLSRHLMILSIKSTYESRRSKLLLGSLCFKVQWIVWASIAEWLNVLIIQQLSNYIHIVIGL